MSDFRFTNSKVLHEGKWLRMLQYEYEKAGDSKQLSWELVERTTRAGTADAADIIAIVKKDHEPDQIVIVKQYRPPIKGWILEFPAGLIDAGETAEATALRELKVCTYLLTMLFSKSDRRKQGILVLVKV